MDVSAVEFGHYKITVNSYAPGIVETPMCTCAHGVLTLVTLRIWIAINAIAKLGTMDKDMADWGKSVSCPSDFQCVLARVLILFVPCPVAHSRETH